MKPFLILSPFYGDPPRTPGLHSISAQACTREGIGYEATSDFVPFYVDLQEAKGYIVI